jgi:hypothetical protein
MTVEVTHEPSVYEEGSPHSWVLDLYWLSQTGDHSSLRAAAVERLERWSREQETWTGREAQRRDRVVRGRTEARTAMSTAPGHGGDLVPPAYMLVDTALYRPKIASFLESCRHRPLPSYGMTIQVPNFASASGVDAQTENTGVDEVDPTTANRVSGALPYFNANVSTQTGQVTASTQTFERGGQMGYTFDLIVRDQLDADLYASCDSFAITTVIADITASAVTDATAPLTITNFWKDVAKAKQSVATSAGVNWRPTHLFAPSPVVDYVEEQVDAQGLPVFLPGNFGDYAANLNKDDGDSGYSVQSLHWMRDDNIPTASGNFQLLVGRPDSVIVFDGDQIFDCFVQTEAQDLSVIFNKRQYIAVVPLNTNGHCVITGAAYPTSLSA